MALVGDGVTYYISIIEKPLFGFRDTTPHALVPPMIKKIVKNKNWTSFINSEVNTYENGTTVTTLYFRSESDLKSARQVFPLDTWTVQSGELTTADI